MDLLIEDNGQVLAIYFSQSEENLKKTLPLPWLSFCTDESAYAPEGVFLKSGAHPAEALRIERRGRLQTGYFADIVVFDAGIVRDLATFENPHRYSTGIVHVLLNGDRSCGTANIRGRNRDASCAAPAPERERAKPDIEFPGGTSL
jgi:N-acyl-D-amino-acid deacylase